MRTRKSRVKQALCAGLCAALLAGNAMPAMAADLCVGKAQPAAETYNVMPSNVTQSGPLTIESHLQARMGYTTAYYTVYIYAPSDVVGIQINDMAVLDANAVKLTGSVREVRPQTGDFGSITVKVTLYYANGSTYSSYETINVNHWCVGTHANPEHCTP